MSDIIVKFKPQGDKELVAAINAIQAAQRNLTNSGKKYNVSVANMTAKLKAHNSSWKKLGVSMATVGRAAKGSRVDFEKLNIAMRRNIKSGGGMIRNNRLISNSLATIRSHLLLYSFALSMGIKQTMDLAKNAAKVKNIEKAFENLSGGTEDAALSMIKLRAATNGTMSDFDLLQQANNAMILAVTSNSDEMAEMFDMAQRLGRALGVDTKRSIESLVTGLGRQSVKMLDNIGIIVKSNDAYEDYAKANGLVASQLTDTQKRQAFFNAALTSGRKKMKQLGPETSSTQDSFDSLAATIDNLGVAFGNIIGPAMVSAVNDISDFLSSFTQGEWEQLAHNMESSGIDWTKYEGIVSSVNQELKENKEAQAELMSGTFMDAWDDATDKGESHVDMLEKMGLSLKTVQSGSAIFSRMVSAAWNNASLANLTALSAHSTAYKILKEGIEGTAFSIVDFNGATEETLHLLDEQILARQALVKSTLEEIDLLSKAKQDDKTKREIEQGRITLEQHNLELEALTSLIPALEAYLNLQKKQVPTPDEDKTKAFATELKALDQKAILEQKLLDTQIEFQKVMEKANVDAVEKAESDTKALELKQKEIDLTEKLIKMELEEAAATLKTSQQKKKTTSQAFSALADLVGMNEKYAKAAAAIEASGAVVDAFAGAQSTFAQTSKIAPPPFPQIAYAAALATGLVNARKVAMSANDVGSGGGGGSQYEQGGYVGGRRHSQGGTMIEAEKGEFVMSRNAVESVGLETLNQMNQGGGGGSINVTVTGNVLTQDFVEGELAESIKEAVRRGSDFGLS